jgi:hypothetical protein
MISDRHPDPPAGIIRPPFTEVMTGEHQKRAVRSRLDDHALAIHIPIARRVIR